jgi:hypothetical protein
MNLSVAHVSACLLTGTALFGFNTRLTAQTVGRDTDSQRVVIVASVELPDAPLPQLQVQTPAQTPATPPAQPSTDGSAQAGSASSAAQATPDAAKPAAADTPQKSKEQLAEEQLKQEKKQRVLGFLPSFNTSYNDSAVSLTARQKFKLAFTSATDPVQFGVAGFVALIGQAEGSDYEYGGGIGGYGKRFGADYADAFDGAMIGNALLPAILHQDPRFFRRGYGSKTRRMLYAISTSVICRHDETGKREPNYSNVLGNLAAGGISNLYAPSNERGVGNTFEGALLVTAEGGVGSILQEFWPDLSRHFLHKDPTHGQDAVNNEIRK